MTADNCYRAVQSRDARFDGWFFTAVTSTGIYCRPSCPARTPARQNVRFYPSAAAAQQAGFRACLRCRPDAAPGSPEWNVRADVVGRAMRLIGDGLVDREGVSGLARRLGYGTRHLNRVLTAEVGAGPLALARAQRAQTARILVETTDLPMADVAFAAGFASVRQFNDTLRQVLARTPSELRTKAQARDRALSKSHPHGHHAPSSGQTEIGLRLPYRRPMAVGELFSFLGARAIPGLESYDGSVYRRSLRLPHGGGSVELSPVDGHVAARLRLADLRDLTTAVGRCRRLLDLDADPEAIDAALSEDASLAPLVAMVPGLRVPGSVDGFELAVRAVIGQQVSVSGARTVAGRLVAAVRTRSSAGAPDESGRTGPTNHDDDHELGLFPSPEEMLAAPDEAFAMPATRRRTIRALAAAVAEEDIVIDPGATPARLASRLMALPGIGPWTAAYVALRALRDPDAFLPTDLGVRRGLERLGLGPHDTERWRPWRAYAMTHLWAAAAMPPADTERRRETGIARSRPHPTRQEDAA